MDGPLVSVICLCYNQAAYVAESIHSVQQQTYSHLELIIVDDASTDQSVSTIKAAINDISLPHQTLFRTVNGGNCTAFNEGLALASGSYIIDLAADDILLADRVKEGVNVLERLPLNYGVHYCEADAINIKGKVLKSQRAPKPIIYEGDVYRSLIEHYWINPATMMIRKKVLDELHGYDESLSYEDFDFWIRSSRNYLYAYSEQTLVHKRDVSTSLGSKQKLFRNKHECSTFRICQKVKALNVTPEENKALKKRVSYEIKRCLRLGHLRLAWNYQKLLKGL